MSVPRSGIALPVPIWWAVPYWTLYAVNWGARARSMTSRSKHACSPARTLRSVSTVASCVPLLASDPQVIPQYDAAAGPAGAMRTTPRVVAMAATIRRRGERVMANLRGWGAGWRDVNVRRHAHDQQGLRGPGPPKLTPYRWRWLTNDRVSVTPGWAKMC